MAPACLGIITHGKRKGGALGIIEQWYCNSLGLELLEIKLLVLRVYCPFYENMLWGHWRHKERIVRNVRNYHNYLYDTRMNY